MSNISHPYFGGARGMSGIMPYTTLPWAVGLALAAIILTINYARSQHGRIALAIRDHQDASELIGAVSYTHLDVYKRQSWSVA